MDSQGISARTKPMWKRFVSLTFLLVLVLFGCSRSSAERIILIPLDSRPASCQFPQMIGAIDGVKIEIPPDRMLGQFITPGSPDAILSWLKGQDLSDVKSIIVSTDMLAYGGLIASRIGDTAQSVALARLGQLDQIRKLAPNAKVYAFSAVMRLAPTATKSAAAWRLDLAQYVELQNKLEVTGDQSIEKTIKHLGKLLPKGALPEYIRTRSRNLKVQQELIRLTANGTLDYLLIGQDDARPFGPHKTETALLKEMVTSQHVSGKVMFCEGIDQHPSVLVSRALLKQADWTPRIKVVYSDEEGARKIANFETKPIAECFRDQLIASGARPVVGDAIPDFTVFVNVPGRRVGPFQEFVESIGRALERGDPVALADVNIAKSGIADSELFKILWDRDDLERMISYAAWNTAGNTMGTTIPAANVYLLALKNQKINALNREVSQREFLLHRLVNDYAYHRFSRPLAYLMIDENPRASREETYGSDLVEVNGLVRRDLSKRLAQYFNDKFMGMRFLAGDKVYSIETLSDVKIGLPWPRAYEVSMDFKLGAKEVSGG